MRAKFVTETIKFERGQDPKDAMDIGANRKVRKGDRVEVSYKGETFTVTAIEDETEEKGDVCVLSGISGREPEYESRICKQFYFVDDDDGICFANANESWDNEGNTIWPWEVPDYEDPVLEGVNFERGRNPKEAMGLGMGPDFKAVDKMAKKFGFAVTEEPTHPDATVTWNNPEKGNVHYVYGNAPFFWNHQSANPKKWYVVIEPEETGERYPDETDIWMDPEVWRRVFDIKY